MQAQIDHFKDCDARRASPSESQFTGNADPGDSRSLLRGLRPVKGRAAGVLSGWYALIAVTPRCGRSGGADRRLLEWRQCDRLTAV